MEDDLHRLLLYGNDNREINKMGVFQFMYLKFGRFIHLMRDEVEGALGKL